MLIFSEFFQRNAGTINYLDIGARGGVGSPWTKFSPGMLNIIGFEPDLDEAKSLSLLNPERTYYPNALWGSDEMREFYLCEWESTSSMYPPDETNNTKYADSHSSKRKVKKVVEVRCNTLDGLLNRSDFPDFIKIDTQGSELEILKGAKNILTECAPIVLAETWCAPIYKGIPLTHQVMEFMYDLGYSVFDLGVAAAWSHKTKALSDSHCKQTTIGFDLVFVKNTEMTNFDTLPKLLKHVALLELYGFRDYAISLLEKTALRCPEIELAIGMMVKNENFERSLMAKIKRYIRRKISLDASLWPKLH